MSRIDPDVCAGHGKPCVKKAATQTMFGCNKKQRLQKTPQWPPRVLSFLLAPLPRDGPPVVSLWCRLGCRHVALLLLPAALVSLLLALPAHPAS